MNKKSILTATMLLVCFMQSYAQKPYSEMYRPQIHFSPKAHWTNDPNGMVYYNSTYHLFFQYYPDSTVWGPMHWGHTISTDLIHWQEQPIALYPDSLGYIFSGSAVIDENNTSGFGKDGKAPLVAIFTHHDPKGEKAGSNTYQNQSLAYSNDNGKTWIKYVGNPVLKSPGITDFRDPKVMWYEPEKKWVMTLATKDCITFYASPDLKKWTKESEFGKTIGAHGGVWECPDLFTLDDNGKKVWVLIVNINPGGPNGGSATQYFIGDFDGKTFKASHTDIRWLDYGPDEYAGITWGNTGDRKIFLGWMSNWLYANVVPTETWRNAMTIPKELKLIHVGEEIYITSEPVAELKKIEAKAVTLQDVKINKTFDLSAKAKTTLPCKLDLKMNKAADFSITISNDKNENIVISYSKEKKQFFIDRSQSGKVDFNKDFPAKHLAPRFINADAMDISLVIDVSSVELFADDGLSVMTEIFFPSKPYDKITIASPDELLLNKITYTALNSIWQ